MVQSKLWKTGVFVYGQALPLVFTSNLIYWVPWFKVADDLELTNDIKFQKSSPIATWRALVIQASHWLPALVMLLEILMNKIRIPWHHFSINFVITLVYILVGYISQILSEDIAVYYTRLNFNCMKDYSYL